MAPNETKAKKTKANETQPNPTHPTPPHPFYLRERSTCTWWRTLLCGLEEGCACARGASCRSGASTITDTSRESLGKVARGNFPGCVWLRSSLSLDLTLLFTHIAKTTICPPVTLPGLFALIAIPCCFSDCCTMVSYG